MCQSPWLAARWLSPLVDLPNDLGFLGHWVLICKVNDRVWSELHARQRLEVNIAGGKHRQWEDSTISLLGRTRFSFLPTR